MGLFRQELNTRCRRKMTNVDWPRYIQQGYQDQADITYQTYSAIDHICMYKNQFTYGSKDIKLMRNPNC